MVRCNGSYRLVASVALLAIGVAFAGAQIPLAYNFNGMAHYQVGSPNDDWPGWGGVADVPNGYRSISDRGLLVDGSGHWSWSYSDTNGWEWAEWPSFGTSPLIGGTGLQYSIVTTGHTADLVMLGNRNDLTAFDPAPNDDNVGTLPTWLPDPDQSGPQTTVVSPALPITTNSTLGLLYNISNGGGVFEVALGFGDGSSRSFTLNGPDWWGKQENWFASNGPLDPAVLHFGLIGTYASVGNLDNPYANEALSVVESVITLSELAGKTLTSITFQNRGTASDYAMYAATLDATQIALAYNFNGMVHFQTGSPNNEWAGWGGIADVADGYRSISDRGLVVDGASHWGWNYNSYNGWEWAEWPSFGTSPLVGGTGLHYAIVTRGHAADMVMLGDRNTVDNGYSAFDAFPDDDELGIQPTWLADPDLSGPQTTTVHPAVPISASSTLGLLYNVSNGGGTFEVVLGFGDGSSQTVTLNAPDWWGTQDQWFDTNGPIDPAVTHMGRFGTFASVGNKDNAYASETLSVVESVITLSAQAGKTLASLTFQNRSVGTSDYAIYAATIAPILGDLNCDGAVNFGDINPFVLALSDPAGYAQRYPDCNILNGDINGNGTVGFDDINPFVTLLTGK